MRLVSWGGETEGNLIFKTESLTKRDKHGRKRDRQKTVKRFFGEIFWLR